MLDEGHGVERDPAAAAEMLLRGAAEDGGAIIESTRKVVTTGDPTQGDVRSSDTVLEMPYRLAEADLYTGGLDGVAGPQLVEALDAWRRGGFDPEVLGL